LKPRCGTVRDRIIASSLELFARKPVHDHDKDGQTIYRDEDKPLQPGGFPLVFQELREQVEQDNAQPVERMEDHKKEQDRLEVP
jgi:hypothetical protein